MKNLIKNLQDLSLTCNVIGIKQSFEDEGVSTEDVILARRITDKCNLQSFVKIGTIQDSQLRNPLVIC